MALNTSNLFLSLCIFGIIPTVWVILSLATLFSLRSRSLDDLPQAIWALVIVLVPILGALAYLIILPGMIVPPQSE